MSNPAPKQKNNNSVPVIYGAPEGHDARIIAERARALMPQDRTLIHIALDDSRIATLKNLLNFFAPDIRVIEFHAWDCLPYDRVSPNNEITAARVAALTKMMVWSAEQERYPRIILTSVNAAMQRVMPRSALEQSSLQVLKNSRLDIDHLQNYLAANGYMRTDTVREAGEFAIRGGIIDLFPASFAKPVRIDLFGDTVETIKPFDPETQRSESSIKEFTLQPATEFLMDEDSIERFRKGYREAFGVISSDDPLYAAVSEGRRYNGMDHWLPLFYEQMETLFDYVPNADVVMDYNADTSASERAAQIDDFYGSRKTLQEAAARQKKLRGRQSKDVSLSGAVYHPLETDRLYLAQTDLNPSNILSPFGAPQDGETDEGGKKGRDFVDIRALPDGDVFAELKKHIAAQHTDKTLIASYSEGARVRLRGLLEASGFTALIDVANADDLKRLKSNEVGIAILPLERGFTAPDLCVLTEQDILGDRLTRSSGKRKKADNFLKEVSSLDEGDLVVHLDHGVGKFIALETLKAAGTLHDCLKLEYAGGDKLYVPVENLEVLSRFGSDEGTTQLDRLGGAGWQARKARVKKDLMVMADGLLKIAAARQLKKAEKLDISADLYHEFAARFPYNETEDQERAINDTLAGLAGDHPMDRLVCGDVGFGKTEVALRAAYVAAMAGAQVALAVPTTLLARQHYQNFIARLSGTSLRVDQLSRMATPSEIKRTKEGLADGSVNIVIGTHALFAKDVRFAHLGLLIVDEEQRFGVKQKERLKEIKNNVHILTLTATPIPRTLQMSLTGVKEMSLITTPPVDRLAIRTFVMPTDEMIIREALMREHYRGGQSFYVCPRIKDIHDIEDMLAELVPELKCVIAHGQMSATDLDDRMTAFYDGQYDILLATNIIESGIDIPTANTMIVHRADMFGLAQLYQIRGRIGRSKVRAYAYLTYQPNKALNDNAMKRLEVMETLDTLGAGFQLASHDMDIRGAGNLLGDQQSGHIREIGVELYQQMLEEAVAMAREGVDMDDIAANENWSPQINLGTSVLIPDHYVEDLGVRMSLYRRLQDLLTPDDIEHFAAEMIDRFGALPDEVQNLLDIVEIKQLCKTAGIAQIDAGPKGAVIAFHNNTPPNVAGLMGWMQEKVGTVKLRHDQKLVAMRVWEKPAQRAKGARNLVGELAKLT